MAKRDIRIKELWQKLRENLLIENINTVPGSVEEFFASNIFQRTLAHIVGHSDSQAVLIKATSAGELKVSVSGTGFEHNNTIAKFNSADAYVEKIFAQVVSRVDVTTWDFGIIIKRLPTADAGYEDEFEIPANTFYSFDCSTYKVSVKNATAGSNANCQIVGWY